MVTINGVEFVRGKYKNGESIFGEVSDLHGKATINCHYEGYADIFHICMALKYVSDYVPMINIKILVSDFYMVDKLETFKKLLIQLGEIEDNISIKKSYKIEYATHNKNINCMGQLRFSGDESIGKFLLSIVEVWEPTVNIPYLPYARMDRQVAYKIFALLYFAEILNSFGFKAIYTYDVHNSTSYDLITNLTGYAIYPVVEKVINEYEPDIICYPDEGAYRKYNSELCDFNIPSIYAVKLRNEVNHEVIVKYELNTQGVELKGKKVLIVDDICSTGSTLIKAATLLKEKEVDDIAVYVSHCENSMFDGPLFASGLISMVYTTNSIKRSRECKMIKAFDNWMGLEG